MVQTPDPMRPIGAADRARLLGGNAIGVASMVVWAAGFPAAEHLLTTGWEPLPLVAARFLVAVAFLLPAWVLLDGPRVVAQARWGRGTIMGGMTFGAGAYLLLLAQALTDPVTVAIIAAACPITATVIEMIYERRRLNLGFLLGLLASVVGGIIATGGTAPAQLGLGALCAIGSCTLFSLGSYFTVRDFAALSPVGRTTITLAGGLIFTGAAFLLANALGAAPLPVVQWDNATLGSLALYALGSMALSQFLWLAAVGRLGVAVASFHINAAPFYVMLILLALGAGWSWPQAIGAAVVGLGVILAQR